MMRIWRAVVALVGLGITTTTIEPIARLGVADKAQPAIYVKKLQAICLYHQVMIIKKL